MLCKCKFIVISSTWRFASVKKQTQVVDASFPTLSYNSVEIVPCYEARAAFTVNSASVFKTDVGIVPDIIDDRHSHSHVSPCPRLPHLPRQRFGGDSLIFRRK